MCVCFCACEGGAFCVVHLLSFWDHAGILIWRNSAKSRALTKKWWQYAGNMTRSRIVATMGAYYSRIPRDDEKPTVCDASRLPFALCLRSQGSRIDRRDTSTTSSALSESCS